MLLNNILILYSRLVIQERFGQNARQLCIDLDSAGYFLEFSFG